MTQLSFSYFPGCSSESTGSAYTASTNYLAKKIGLELIEIKDWNCCGTSAARLTDEDLSYALPGRSLALSEKHNPGLDVVATCTGCYASLKRTLRWAQESEKNREHLQELIGMEYPATAEVKSLLEVLVNPEIAELIASKVEKTLGDMKVACYYGCAQVRPADLCEFGDVENPTSLENLLDACGASCIDWSFKTECCGASNHVVSPKIARKATERILRNAKANGAQAIVTSCPLCWLNLDMREPEINREMGTDYHIPVFFFTELLALALGASEKEAGLNFHFEPCVDFINRTLAAKDAPEPAQEAAEEAAKAKQPAEEQPKEVAR